MLKSVRAPPKLDEPSVPAGAARAFLGSNPPPAFVVLYRPLSSSIVDVAGREARFTRYGMVPNSNGIRRPPAPNARRQRGIRTETRARRMLAAPGLEDRGRLGTGPFCRPARIQKQKNLTPLWIRPPVSNAPLATEQFVPSPLATIAIHTRPEIQGLDAQSVRSENQDRAVAPARSWQLARHGRSRHPCRSYQRRRRPFPPPVLGGEAPARGLASM